MAEKAKRDTSPLVFVRNPHSFAPLSAQRIPPPPSWKPPPLPKDLDVNSSKNDQDAGEKCNIDLYKDDRAKVIPSDLVSPASSTAKSIMTFTKDSIGDAEEMSLTPTKEDHSTGLSSKVENYLEDSIQKRDNSNSADICGEEGNLEKCVNPKDTKEVNINLISDQPTIPCDSISFVTNTSEPFTSLMNSSIIDTVEINIIPPEKDHSIDRSSEVDNYIKERFQTQERDYIADICEENENLQSSVKLDETQECTIQSLYDESTIPSGSIAADTKTVTCLDNSSIIDRMEPCITSTEKSYSIDSSSTASNNLENCLQAHDSNYITTVCKKEENAPTQLNLEENTSVTEVNLNEIIAEKTSTEILEERTNVNVESPDLESSKPVSKNIVNIDDYSRVSNNKTDTNGDKSKQDKIEDIAAKKLEKKCNADVNDNKRHKKLASISISKLEEELDSLPIPEFPSLYTTDELDILPMSQYPVPSDAITQDCAAVIQEGVDVSQGQKHGSTPTMSPSNNESSNDLIGIRSNRVSIKSMSANLENITNKLQTTTSESTEKPLENQDNASFTDNTISKENSHLDKIQNEINATTSISNETNGPSNHTAALQDVQMNREKWNAKPKIVRNQPERAIKKEIDDSERRQKEHPETIKSLKKLEINESKDLDRSNPTRASVISRIKSKATNDRRNSLVKTLTRIEPYLLVASSPPEGIRSQRLAELGVSYVVHAATMLGNNNKMKGMLTSHSDGIDISNANLEEGGNNFEIFDAFADKIAQVQKKKGVALVISDETSPSINQRYVYFIFYGIETVQSEY